MGTRMKGRLSLLVLALAVMLAFPAVALADQLANDADNTIEGSRETVTLESHGKTRTVDIYINPTTGGGDQANCNFNAEGEFITVRVSSSSTAAATAVWDEASATNNSQDIDFTGCDDPNTTTVKENAQTVKVTSGTQTGKANIDFQLVNNSAGGTFTDNTARFEVDVTQDLTPPTVSSVAPTDGATDVPVVSNVEATFSEKMDTSTITSSTFTLKKQGASTNLSGTVSYDSATKKATLDPSGNLEHDTIYEATVTTGAKDLAGNLLDQDPTAQVNQSKTWSFRTAPPPDSTPPSVSSIMRADANPTKTTGNLNWTVTFSENVTGVDTGDFAPASNGLSGSPAIASVTQGANASVYTVAVSTGTGSGTLGLNLNDNDSIADSAGNKLGGTGTGTAGGGGTGNGSFTGEVYTIDRAAPTVTSAAVKGDAPNFTGATNYQAGDWTNKDVRVTFTCADTGGSGLTAASGNQVKDFTTETSGTTATFDGTCVDNAGNTAAGSTFGPIKIDKTAPSSNATATVPDTDNDADSDPDPYTSNTWTKENVTVTLGATDNSGGSGVKVTQYSINGGAVQNYQNPFTLNSAGEYTIEYSSTDNALNTEQLKTFTVKIDKTKPVISPSAKTQPGGANYTAGTWTNKDVEVSFSCLDSGGSGIKTNAVAGSTVTTQGADQSVTNTGSCTDNAGNVADSATFSNIDIDKTAPVIADLGAKKVDSNGDLELDADGNFVADQPTGTDNSDSANPIHWYNHDVTNVFRASDELSGFASGTDDPHYIKKSITDEGKGLKASSGTVTDLAGNEAASIDSAGFNIDKTKPQITHVMRNDDGDEISPVNGWFNASTGRPTAHFECSDLNASGANGSGVKDTCPADFAFGEGADQRAPLSDSYKVSDYAGNESDAYSVTGVNVDTFVPNPSAPDLVATSDSGVNDDNITRDNTPTFKITVKAGSTAAFEPGSTVELYAKKGQEDPVLVGSGTANNNGEVEIKADRNPGTSDEDVLADGTYTFFAKATDVAGNVSTVDLNDQTKVTIATIDTAVAAPTLDLATSSDKGRLEDDNITNEPKPTFEGTAEAGSTVNLYVDGTALADTATADASGNWSLTPTAAFSDGNYTITAKATDVAENVSTDSDPLRVTIDTARPDVSYAAANGPVNEDVTNTAWRNTNLSQPFTASDSGSSVDVVASNPADDPFVMANDGTFTLIASANSTKNSDGSYTATTVSKTVYDLAGNPTTRKLSAFIDKIKPQISYDGVKGGTLGPDGWYLTAVTAGFKAEDTLSGLADANQASFTQSSGTVEGSAVKINSNTEVKDKAGNVADNVDSDPFQIDLTDPKASHTLSAAANANGWHNANVTVTLSATDKDALGGNNGSGVKQIFYKINNASDFTPVSGNSVQILVNSEGTTTISYYAKDNAGRLSSQGSATAKLDKTAPVITFSNSVFSGSPKFDFGSVPAQPTCSADDGTGSGVDGGCSVSGYNTAVGSHTLEGLAKDLAGNVGKAQLPYSVIGWTLKGFYQPVDYGTITNNVGSVWNTVKNGSTVPLKFEVFNSVSKTELTDTAIVNPLKATQVNCTTGVTDEIELTATGSTSLRYDSTSGQFVYNWQTPKKPGYCYYVSVTTIDGSSTPIAKFQLK